MNIGLAIKTTRQERGMQQGDLAGRVGLSSASISKIEKGKVWPTHNSLVAIAAALKMPLGVLILRGMERNDFAWYKQQTFDELQPVLHSILERLI